MPSLAAKNKKQEPRAEPQARQLSVELNDFRVFLAELPLKQTASPTQGGSPVRGEPLPLLHREFHGSSSNDHAKQTVHAHEHVQAERQRGTRSFHLLALLCFALHCFTLLCSALLCLASFSLA
jgi:ABC-type nickel/cobalt efflux system permease component RcnA